MRHALPLLVVVGTIRLVLLKHERNVQVKGIAFRLSETHVSTWMPLKPMTRNTLVWTQAV